VIQIDIRALVEAMVRGFGGGVTEVIMDVGEASKGQSRLEISLKELHTAYTESLRPAAEAWWWIG
jgi:hypothetical protein